MKRGIFIIGLFLFLFIMSKAQQWEWAKKHDFEFTETQSTIGGADSEGNLYLTLMNISDVKNQPGAAYRLLKLDPNGQIIWSKDISQYSQGRITTGPNGNSYIAYAGKLGCFDKEGNETWKVNDFNVKSFGKLKIRNGVLIVDGSEYAGIDSITLFTAAYSLQGGLISKTYLNLNKFAKTAWDQQLHVWAIHGWYPDPVTSNTGKLLKFDSTGSMLFSREIPYPDGILIDSEGNAYVNGGFRAPIELGGKKYAVPADLIASYQFIAKYSVTGQLLWYKIIEGSLGANRMSCDKEGNLYYVVDFSAHIKIEDFEISHATGGLLVIKYDKEGNKIWHQFTSSYNTGPFGYLQPVSMFVANDNEIYLSGMIKGQLLFGNTFVKTHSNDYSELFVGKISQKNMVSLRESSVNESLWQVYPNPSGDIFYLNSLNADEMLITVTDVRGQLVKTIIDKNQRKVDLTGLANGMYLLKIQCGNRSETKKIVKN